MIVRRRMRVSGWAKVVGLAAVCGLPAADAAIAQVVDHAGEYQACLALVERAPSDALAGALAWEAVGGGPGARHCAAAAHYRLGNYDEAAARFIDLAAETVAERPAAAADLYDQGARAALYLNDVETALLAAARAVALAPDLPTYQITRSYALAATGDYWAVLDALNVAGELAPNAVEVHLLTAAAYRHLGVYDLAADAVARGLTTAPGDPELLLERGNIRAAAGDLTGAREDWQHVALTVPDTAPGRAAAANLERVAP